MTRSLQLAGVGLLLLLVGGIGAIRIGFERPLYTFSESEESPSVLIIKESGQTSTEIFIVRVTAVPSTSGAAAATLNEDAEFNLQRTLSNVLVFPPDRQSVQYSFSIVGDSEIEQDEEFMLLLSNDGGPEFEEGQYPQTTVRIIDDDAVRVSFEMPQYEAQETIELQSIQIINENNATANDSLTIVIQLRPPDGEFQAATIEDFRVGGFGNTRVANPLNPGQRFFNFVYEIITDHTVEGDEWFTLTLSQGLGPEFILGRHPTTTVRIIDNEFNANIDKPSSFPFAGQPYTLNCTIELGNLSLPLPNTEWLYPREDIDSSVSVVETEPLKRMLVFDALQTSHAGQYSCRSSLDVNRTTTAVTDVIVNIPTPLVSVTGGFLPEGVVNTGDTLTLSCIVEFDAAVELAGIRVITVWRNEDEILTSNGRITLSEELSGGRYQHTATLTTLRVTDSGNYSCEVTAQPDPDSEFIVSSAAVLDTITITVEDLPDDNDKLPIGAIVGIGAGGALTLVLVVLLCIAVVVCIPAKRQHKCDTSKNSPTNEGPRNDGLPDDRIAMSDCAAYESGLNKSAPSECVAYELDENNEYENYDYVK